MTQNEKDLLLKDLCARLPYGVKIDNIGEPSILVSINNNYNTIVETTEVDEYNLPRLDVLEIEDAKPYLFPLSSMTEEQHKEFYDKYCWNDGGDNFEMDSCSHYYALEKFDWLLKNHFDYRGLIPLGLANDATGKNIY